MGFKSSLLPVTELQSQQILSLPIHHNLNKKQLNYVIENVNNFYSK